MTHTRHNWALAHYGFGMVGPSIGTWVCICGEKKQVRYSNRVWKRPQDKPKRMPKGWPMREQA